MSTVHKQDKCYDGLEQLAGWPLPEMGQSSMLLQPGATLSCSSNNLMSMWRHILNSVRNQ